MINTKRCQRINGVTVKNAKWCPVHLSGSHEISNCTQRNDSKLVCGINGCNKHHHRSFHGSTTPFIAEVNSSVDEENNVNGSEVNSTVSDSDNVLLSIQTVNTLSGSVSCFFDNGSTCCLILNSTAKQLQLKGEDVTITISTVNGDEKNKKSIVRSSSRR